MSRVDVPAAWAPAEPTARAVEEERSRIAAELHDGPLQSLSALAMAVDRLERQLATGDVAAARVLASLTRSALVDQIRELRQVTTGLRPAALDRIGLEAAVRSLLDGAGRRAGFSWTLDADLGHRPVGRDVETAVFGIVREAVTNVEKHAAAAHVAVEIRLAGPAVSVLVADDGRGFDPGRSGAGPDHFGIDAMRGRAERARGHCDLASVPGVGTAVRALVPCEVAA